MFISRQFRGGLSRLANPWLVAALLFSLFSYPIPFLAATKTVTTPMPNSLPPIPWRPSPSLSAKTLPTSDPLRRKPMGGKTSSASETSSVRCTG